MSSYEQTKADQEKLQDTIKHKTKLIEMDLNRGISTWSDTYDLQKAAEKLIDKNKEAKEQAAEAKKEEEKREQAKKDAEAK